MNGNQVLKQLYNRITFGASPVTSYAASSAEAWKILLKDSLLFDPLTDVATSFRPQQAPASKEEKKEIMMKYRQETLKLNISWMNRLISGKAAVREKMTLFWHDHFACRTREPDLAQQQNNILRQHALGNFGALLMAVSKDPAMLQFLNNQQNKKDHPNENFAREVLELFTLGRGCYTEDDIKNAARAFTGWAFNPATNQFVFRARVHDEGAKVFMNKRGNFTGDDIINIILEDKRTAHFITAKIWAHLVSTDEQDADMLASLANKFYASGYDLSGLLTEICTSDWFYDKRYLGNRIKSPVELITGIITQTDGTFANPESLIFLQKALGQILFIPPNVGGWPIGREWIDSSSLTFRMSLPGILLRNKETDFQVKDDGDVNNAANTLAKPGRLLFSANWKLLTERFVKSTAEETLQAAEDFILARPTTTENRTLVRTAAGQSKDDPEFIQKVFIGFMSLPEYQLC